MVNIRTLFGCICMTILLTACGKEPALPQIEQAETVGTNGSYTCTYLGTEREFLVCPPEIRTESSPVIFMLHGYGSKAESFQLDTKMDKTACPQGYTVIYVSGIPNPTDKTSASCWNSGIAASPVDDTGFLKALAHYAWENLGCDADRTYAAGFSNGAFMVHRLALEAADTFSGFASVAGMTPEQTWENRTSIGPVSFLQISGTKDDVIPMRANTAAGHTNAPAIEDTLDFFISEGKLEQTEETALSEKSTLTKYGGSTAEACVWSVVIEDGSHTWPREQFAGFDTNSLILEFFDTIAESLSTT